MLILDGNNSQKRSVFATEDHRTFDSDYFLSEETVNTFHKRVKVLVPVVPAVTVEAREIDVEVGDVAVDLVADDNADVGTLLGGCLTDTEIP